MSSLNELIGLFASRLKQNGGWCETANNSDELTRILSGKAGVDKNAVYYSKKAVLLAGEMLSEIGTPVVSISVHELKAKLAVVETGITSCDGLIAETGTAVCIADHDEPRILSLLPQKHIVIAKVTQLYSDLGPCLASIYSQYSSPVRPSITLISGPSRTSDIEKTLVTGVHGPMEFGVIVLMY
jgi:L-lactate utilization protein LutC